MSVSLVVLAAGTILGSLGAIAAKASEREQRDVINDLQDKARSQANARSEFLEAQNSRDNRIDSAVNARNRGDRIQRFTPRQETFKRDFGFSVPNPSAFTDFLGAGLQGAVGGLNIGQDVLKGISSIKKLESGGSITQKEGEKARNDVIKKSINDGTLGGQGDGAAIEDSASEARNLLTDPLVLRNRQFDQNRQQEQSLIAPRDAEFGQPVQRSIFQTANNQNTLTPGVNPFSKFG